MTLAAQIAADVTTVFQNTEHFAVAVTYYPLDGDPVPFDTDVEKDTMPRVEGGIDLTSTIYVFAKKDASQIINPQIGDRFREDTDPEDEFYSYNGEIEFEDAASWWLVFTKRVNNRMGGNTVR